ncbi:hypothetical protein CGERO_01475 [Corynebacterium gerontici]|uniref:Nudix hydrolase domain-containing protein n=2 Tax=Corynebacterium gerontici TaxID=2079234 RepID=A0A3G6IXY8_9CORY|nr:hypothetical protein CGERO_01475 [Corynebacterium gerontici]
MRLWGKYGAAGLLLVYPENESFHVLMQHRASWTSQGDTWALPGGARDLGETPEQTAAREAYEETGVRSEDYNIVETRVTAGPFEADPQRPELAGGWTYSTVLALAEEKLSLLPNEESYELRWVEAGDVEKLKLMPAFAQAWPELFTWIASRI